MAGELEEGRDKATGVMVRKSVKSVSGYAGVYAEIAREIAPRSRKTLREADFKSRRPPRLRTGETDATTTFLIWQVRSQQPR